MLQIINITKYDRLSHATNNNTKHFFFLFFLFVSLRRRSEAVHSTPAAILNFSFFLCVRVMEAQQCLSPTFYSFCCDGQAAAEIQSNRIIFLKSPNVAGTRSLPNIKTLNIFINSTHNKTINAKIKMYRPEICEPVKM